MKKLINKLKAKPKLYKCLKILGVVGICLSLVFNALIIGSAIAFSHGNSKNNEVQPHNVATTPITKRSLDYNGYNLIYSLGEILNTYMLNNFIDEKPQFWASLSVNDQIDYIYGEYPGSSYGSWSSVDYDTCVIRNGTSFDGFRFIVASENINEYRSIYNIDFFVVNTTSHTNNYLATFSYIYSPTVSGSVMNVWGSSNIDLAVYISGLENPKLRDLLYDPDTKGYGEGYNEGYKNGKNYGYNEGYSVGYQDGLENNPTNVFDILATAFNSVASVLNIELLPNFPLGLLIFTPIVVTVIIVVVKMIKG